MKAHTTYHQWFPDFGFVLLIFYFVIENLVLPRIAGSSMGQVSAGVGGMALPVTIAVGCWTKLHPSEVKSKPVPLESDSYLKTI